MKCDLQSNFFAGKPEDLDFATQPAAEANDSSVTEKKSSLQSKATTSVGRNEKAEFEDLSVEILSADFVEKDAPVKNKVEGQEPIEAKNGREESIKNKAVDGQLTAGAVVLPAEVQSTLDNESDREAEKAMSSGDDSDKVKVEACKTQNEVVQQSESISDIRLEEEQVDGVCETDLPVDMVGKSEDDASTCVA